MDTKILIIKLGFSETLDSEIGIVPSLGDVLRTTPILWALKEKYSASNITWLVDKETEPLLHGNKLIDRILVWDEFVPFQLMREKFDVLINLEKVAGICALSDMIDAWVKYGFRFDSITGIYHAYERGLDFIDYIENKKDISKRRDFWQKVLIEMLDVKWNKQEYILGYKPKTKELYDIGLNHEVGSKWPTKVMPMDSWRDLEKKLLGLGYKISWQEGLEDICKYIDWVNSCKVIISHDSLGMHLAIALKKRAIGLFGATDPQEIYTYGKSKIIHSRQKCKYMPCYSTKCLTDQYCMKKIDVDDIVKTAKEFIDGA